MNHQPRTFGLVVMIAVASLLAAPTGEGAVISLDGQWLLAPDPQNRGLEQRWWTTPRPEAMQTKVPWIIQDSFPGYHGVAWYWKEFEAPANLKSNGRASFASGKSTTRRTCGGVVRRPAARRFAADERTLQRVGFRYDPPGPQPPVRHDLGSAE